MCMACNRIGILFGTATAAARDSLRRALIINSVPSIEGLPDYMYVIERSASISVDWSSDHNATCRPSTTMKAVNLMGKDFVRISELLCILVLVKVVCIVQKRKYVNACPKIMHL